MDSKEQLNVWVIRHENKVHYYTGTIDKWGDEIRNAVKFNYYHDAAQKCRQVGIYCTVVPITLSK